jgi:hypothetical protein
MAEYKGSLWLVKTFNSLRSVNYESKESFLTIFWFNFIGRVGKIYSFDLIYNYRD